MDFKNLSINSSGKIGRYSSSVKDMPVCVYATNCAEWQEGVVCITGHNGGRVCLWGIQYQETNSKRTQSLFQLQWCLFTHTTNTNL